MTSFDPSRPAGPTIRPVHLSLGAVNWVGLQSLYLKEVRRFLAVWQQTLAAPVVTTLLFYAVFALALGGDNRMMGAVPFMQFLAPGLIMMTMAQNAFANTSSSLVISKIQGNIVDVLMPPLSPGELTFAYAFGGATRGLLVGVITLAVMMPVAGLSFLHAWQLLVFGMLGSLMLALLGIVGGIWSQKFDHIAAVTNFFVTPLTFLSGTFYSADRLPENWALVAHLNPFFYMIDGFRGGFIPVATPAWTGILVLGAIDLLLWAMAWWMFRSGFKLKP